jgi:putative salt-induced outer membrane protein YdiY
MMGRFNLLLATGITVIVGLGAPAPVFAQDADLGWSDAAELTLVLTDGNAEASTLGFDNTLLWKGDGAQLKVKAGGVRTESTTRTRTAVGTPDDFTIRDESDSEVTAESYYLRGRYDRDMTERFYYYVGADWSRNTFAGFDSRSIATGGVGNVWFERDGASFRTDYAITYTVQDDVTDDPDADTEFVGIRVSWMYDRRLTESTHFQSDLKLDDNGEDPSDFRADLLNSLSVAINDRFALKLSHQTLFDHEPSLESLPLEPPAVPLGSQGGAATGETVMNF